MAFLKKEDLKVAEMRKFPKKESSRYMNSAIYHVGHDKSTTSTLISFDDGHCFLRQVSMPNSVNTSEHSLPSGFFALRHYEKDYILAASNNKVSVIEI